MNVLPRLNEICNTSTIVRSKNVVFFFGLIFFIVPVSAQELFTFTEPASNMPAHAGGIRITNTLMDENNSRKTNIHIMPELMYGFHKNIMVHATAFISNRNHSLETEGAGLYARYRFFSKDDLHRHLRMAVFGRLSFNNSDIHQEEIEINGHNSGFELGYIATQLLQKTAISSTLSFEKAANNSTYKFPANQSATAFNYSLSVGSLILPREYTSFKQTNMNIMVEMLGQTLPKNGRSFLDVAPAVQFIFNSQARLDVGYRFQLSNSMERTAPEGFLLRLEYLLFDPFGTRK
jgi:hypothetical protein